MWDSVPPNPVKVTTLYTCVISHQPLTARLEQKGTDKQQCSVHAMSMVRICRESRSVARQGGVVDKVCQRTLARWHDGRGRNHSLSTLAKTNH
jgi:hypothetical protein